MDQLISQITQRTGVSEQQARDIVTMVLAFVKDKLPAPVASQLDSMLGAQGGTSSAQDMLGGLGGMFGKK